MATYFFISMLLLWLGFAEILAKNRIWGVLGCLILISFAGLRYRIGWDWLGYEQYFHDMKGVLDILHDGIPETSLSVEPLFMIFTALAKTISDDFVLFFLLIALCGIFPIWYVTYRISKRSAAVWIVYFGMVFLAGQMTLMRQVIASSLVLIALLMATQGKKIRKIFLLILATNFQVSSALYLPALLLSNRKPSPAIAFPLVIVGFFFITNKISLEAYIFDIGYYFFPGWIGTKLEFARSIMSTGEAPISIGVIGLICFQIALLLIFYHFYKEAENQNKIINIAIWLTLMMLIAHLYLFGFPTFWNRIMLVALPWQIATLYHIKKISDLPRLTHLGILTLFALISNAALFFSLNKPESLPFIPYHSALQVWISNDEGTGQERIEYSINNR